MGTVSDSVKYTLTPGDAVAAIILVGDKYLLQHRDCRPDIWFPDHWGCFGGNVESGESGSEALLRELSEETGFGAESAQFRLFTRFDFDFGFAGCGRIYRIFFELHLPQGADAELRLGEGQAMGLFTGMEITSGDLRLTPYDAFALWMHLNRSRVVAAT